MTDEQFRALRTLILDQGVKIEGLALAIRTMQRRIEELAADANDYGPQSNSDLIESSELDEILRSHPGRPPKGG